MKKILFTDLFDTLIDEHPKSKEEGKKEFEIVCRCIYEFLKDDNHIAIVTSPGEHNKFGKIFNEILFELSKKLNPDLVNKIAFYLQGSSNILKSDKIVEQEEDGKTYYVGEENGLRGIKISLKEDAIADFTHDISKPYQLYAIGDSYKDIPMLLKNEELGGHSAFIDMLRSKDTLMVDEVINRELKVEFYFEEREIMSKFSKDGIFSKNFFGELSNFNKKRAKRKEELYALLNSGELDLEEVNNRYNRFSECADYAMFSEPPFSKHSNFYINYPFNEELFHTVVNMPSYHSFSDYYTKVLKKN